jgi:hypothetical protein
MRVGIRIQVHIVVGIRITVSLFEVFTQVDLSPNIRYKKWATNYRIKVTIKVDIRFRVFG